MLILKWKIGVEEKTGQCEYLMHYIYPEVVVHKTLEDPYFKHIWHIRNNSDLFVHFVVFKWVKWEFCHNVIWMRGKFADTKHTLKCSQPLQEAHMVPSSFNASVGVGLSEIIFKLHCCDPSWTLMSLWKKKWNWQETISQRKSFVAFLVQCNNAKKIWCNRCYAEI